METNTIQKKGIASLILRTVGFLVGLGGIILHLSVNSLLETGFMVKHNLAYFTLQTNIFSVCIFFVLAVKTLVHRVKSGQLEPAVLPAPLHLACTMYITVTMLGYWLVLTPMSGLPQNGILLLDSILLHTVTPILAILDCALFMPHGQVRKKAALWWLSYPLAYYLSVVAVSHCIKEPYYTVQIGGRAVDLFYPYPFFDPQVMGHTGVLLAVLAAAVFFVLFSLLYITLDARLVRRP